MNLHSLLPLLLTLIASFLFVGSSARAAYDFQLEVVDPAYGGNNRPGYSSSGDVDGDGMIDVLAGGGNILQWYKAPNWDRYFIENPGTSPNIGGNGIAVFDVDGDTDLDVITTEYLGDLIWWENPGGVAAQGYWTAHTIDASINDFMHDMVAGDIDGDGNMELVVLYTGGGGVYVYDLPADPKTDPWPRATIVSSIVDPFIGLALGDIDNDGDLDVVVSREWYEHPADPFSDPWTGYTVFASAVQNVTVADVNKDGRLDIVAAEGFNHPNGRVLWAAAPLDPKNDPWTETVVGSNLDGPENIWAGDIDFDGDIDIVSGEMGTDNGFGDSDSTLLLYEGLAQDGSSFMEHVVASNVGVSARIQPVDIDFDGDIDFVADGNAEDHIYLWRNDTPLPMVDPPVGVPALPTPAALLLTVCLLVTAHRQLRWG